MSDTTATPTPASPDPAAHGPAAHAPAVHGHGEHHGHITDSTFMRVFLVLLVCTTGSFAVNQIFGHHAPAINFLLIALISCIKATLVVAFFMHLKIDWRYVFMFLIPICILAPMVLMVLWPDIVLAWRLSPTP